MSYRVTIGRDALMICGCPDGAHDGALDAVLACPGPEAVEPRTLEHFASGDGFTEQAGQHGFTHVDPEAGYIPDYVNLRRLAHTEVSLKDITVASQPSLNPELVRKYRDEPPKRKVLLRQYGDDIAVVNGHHSIAAARAAPRGEDND